MWSKCHIWIPLVNGRILIAPVPSFFKVGWSGPLISSTPSGCFFLFFFLSSRAEKPWCPPWLSQDKTPYLHFLSFPLKFDFGSEIQGLWPCRRKTDMNLGMIWTSGWFYAHCLKLLKYSCILQYIYNWYNWTMMFLLVKISLNQSTVQSTNFNWNFFLFLLIQLFRFPHNGMTTSRILLINCLQVNPKLFWLRHHDHVIRSFNLFNSIRWVFLDHPELKILFHHLVFLRNNKDTFNRGIFFPQHELIWRVFFTEQAYGSHQHSP